MEDNCKHKSGAGFTWGVIIGSAFTLLFTTKKGRKILREISEVGLDMIERVSEMQNLESIVSEELPEVPQEKELYVETEEKKEANNEKPAKRFFKGVKKKTS